MQVATRHTWPVFRPSSGAALRALHRSTSEQRRWEAESATESSADLVRRLRRVRTEATERRGSRTVLVRGPDLVREALAVAVAGQEDGSCPWVVRSVLHLQASKPLSRSTAARVAKLRVPVVPLSAADLHRVTGTPNPPEDELVAELVLEGDDGVEDAADPFRVRESCALSDPAPWTNPTRRQSSCTIRSNVWLALDEVQDPGNVGSLLRTGWLLGAAGAVLVGGCADPTQAKVLAASRLASLRLPVHRVRSWDALWPEARAGVADFRARPTDGFFALALPPKHPFLRSWAAPEDEEEGGSQTASREAVANATLRAARRDGRPILLCLGNEGHGLSPTLLRRLQNPLLRAHVLPMSVRHCRGDDGVESLNVAVAGALLLDRLLADETP